MHGVWWHLLLAVGFGLVGALVPVLNGEAFIAATLAARLIGPVEVGVCLGLGQGLGKMILFQAVRQAKRLPILHRTSAEHPPPEPGSWRYRWARLVEWGTALVESPRWGPLGLFLSGSLSVPPNYATTIMVATTKINFAVFSIFITVGFIVRYVVVAFALTGVFKQLF
ncbi:hypothetical protein [Brooklawnia sp.]|uniref:hypothetical protein n=1 Tax=Brooklawnia sp. TaxID=2699740 RepID=UPI00311DF1E5